MPWRKSLLVTAILVGLDLALSQLQVVVYTFVFTTSPQIVNDSPGNVAIFAAVLSLARLLIFGVITFFVVAWALRSTVERKGWLRAQDALDMLDEEQVQELKKILIAPSRRAE